MPNRLLLVEPDIELRSLVREQTDPHARVSAVADFPAARNCLSSERYDWVATNIRLNAYNGLHLMHIAAASSLATRVLVYADRRDASLAREAQLSGAFYELRRTVHRALPWYLQGRVPAIDRRNADVLDRRRVDRGGRRCSDGLGSKMFAVESALGVVRR